MMDRPRVWNLVPTMEATPCACTKMLQIPNVEKKSAYKLTCMHISPIQAGKHERFPELVPCAVVVVAFFFISFLLAHL